MWGENVVWGERHGDNVVWKGGGLAADGVVRAAEASQQRPDVVWTGGW